MQSVPERMAGSPTNDGPFTGQQTIFEVGNLIQGVADMLGSYAAHLGVELVLYHGDHPGTNDKIKALQMESGIQELHVKGDEIGLGIALASVSTVKVHLSVDLMFFCRY